MYFKDEVAGFRLDGDVTTTRPPLAGCLPRGGRGMGRRTGFHGDLAPGSGFRAGDQVPLNVTLAGKFLALALLGPPAPASRMQGRSISNKFTYVLEFGAGSF
jgi:hypothetical protein